MKSNWNIYQSPIVVNLIKDKIYLWKRSDWPFGATKTVQGDRETANWPFGATEHNSGDRETVTNNQVGSGVPALLTDDVSNRVTVHKEKRPETND